MFMPIMPDDKIGAAVLAGNFGDIGKFNSKTSGKDEMSDEDERKSSSAPSDESVKR
jgi:hypothetical protein